MDLSSVLANSRLRKIACEKSLYLFGLYYFSHYFTLPSAPFHKELCKLLMFKEHPHLLVIGYRDSAKTVWAKIKLVHNIVYKKHMFNLYVCYDKKSAESNVYDVAIELQVNDKIRRDFGELYIDEQLQGKRGKRRKRLDDFICMNDVRVMAHSAQMTTRGLNHKENRPDFYVLDDFENIKTYKSKARTAQVIDFMDEMVGGIEAAANVLYIANRITLSGSVSYLESKTEERDDIRLYEIKIADENNNLTWADKFVWTDEEAREINSKRENKKQHVTSLESKRAMLGTSKFLREYYNQPTSEETQIIKESWITDNYFHSFKPKNLVTNIMVDPSAGESDDADEFALSVLGWERGDNHRYVLENHGWRHLKITEKAAKIIAFWIKYRKSTREVGIEVVLNQTALYQLLMEWKAGKDVVDGFNDVADRNIPIVKIDPKGRKKQDRLEQHEAMFERGEIHLRSYHNKLREQLISFPNTLNDDRLDTLIYCIERSLVYGDVVTPIPDQAKKQKKGLAGVRTKTF